MNQRTTPLLAIGLSLLLLSACEAPVGRVLVPTADFALADGIPDVTVSQVVPGGPGDPAGPQKPSAFKIEFDEPIDPASFDVTDLSIETSTASGASVDLISPITPGSAYAVFVAATGDGIITLTVAAGAVCAAGHFSGSTCDTGFESPAPTYTDNEIRWDQTGPSVTIALGANETDPTSAATITFDVQFSEDVIGFADGDVVLGGTANPTSAVVIGGPSKYTVSVSGMTTHGTVTASIAADVAIDAALNSNTASSSTASVTWEGDGTPPQTTIALSPSSPNGNNGWYTGAVGVTIGATAAGSPVTETRCVLDPVTIPASFDDLPSVACALSTVTSDGFHDIYAASVDEAGNKEGIQQASFKIDATPPSVICPSPVPMFVVGSTGNTLSALVSDAGSGPLDATVSAPVSASTAGAHSVQVTGADNAGHTTQVSCTYLVGLDILGLFGPGMSASRKAGTALPIKVALGSSTGGRIDDVTAASLAASCGVKVKVSGAQTLAPVCMKYDPTSDEFIYIWRLGAQRGTATIEVTVSNPGTTLVSNRSWSLQIVR